MAVSERPACANERLASRVLTDSVCVCVCVCVCGVRVAIVEHGCRRNSAEDRQVQQATDRDLLHDMLQRDHHRMLAHDGDRLHR